MNARFDFRNEWLFAGLLVSFCAIYSLWYPATISILDESSSIALAYSIEHGTIFTEAAGPFWGLPLGNHTISKFSPFHAALLVPAMALNWRLMFIVTAAFFVAGAFILRGWLRREGLGTGWTALYFLLAGALYYSQTVMAAIPAAVLLLLAVSLCLRDRPRPFLAGLAFGASVLMHPWMAPVSIVFCAVWIVEARFRGLLALALGAMPSIVLLGAYNFATTGSPFQNVYTITGHQHLFQGDHFLAFFAFYAASLAIFPLAGWSAFFRRWTGTYAIPAAGAVVVAMASLYYYRDGLNLGSERVPAAVAELTGMVPGQRFLVPFSMIACVPAARFLNSWLSAWDTGRRTTTKFAALAAFAAGFVMLSIFHQAFLRTAANIQDALHENIPPDAPVAVDYKVIQELPPLPNPYRNVTIVDESDAPSPQSYIAVLLPPGQSAPDYLTRNREWREIKIRSWVWNRDLLIVQPVAKKTS
jgi:hypothetical protein